MDKSRRRLAFFLAMAMVLALAPAVSLAAVLPCGHDSTAPGDHSEAGCGVPGHYVCDGKKHEIVTCLTDFMDDYSEELGDFGIDLSATFSGLLGNLSDALDSIGVTNLKEAEQRVNDFLADNDMTEALKWSASLPDNTISCGHDPSAAGDHSPAKCGIPGHFNCDGKRHDDRDLCMQDFYQNPGQVGTPTIPRLPPIPPGKKPPDEPPTEIKVPKDGKDIDLKPPKGKGYGNVEPYDWTITVNGECAVSNVGGQAATKLNFEAVLPGSKDKKRMFGKYIGTAWMDLRIVSGTGNHCIVIDSGPTAVAFELGDPDDLAPLVPQKDDDLAPLVQVAAQGSMQLSFSLFNWYHSDAPPGYTRDFSPPCTITVYSGGRVLLELDLSKVPGFSGTARYYGTISKK